LDPRELHEWLRVNDGRGFRFDKDEDIERMAKTLAVWKPELVIIDSLSRTHIGDENSVKDMLLVTNWWNRLCVDFNVAVCIIHHLKKNGEDTQRFGDRMRGTGELFAIARQVVGVELRDELVHVSCEGNLSDLPEPFALSVTDDIDGRGKKCTRFARVGDSKDVRFEAVAERVISMLRGGFGETFSMRDIENEVGGNAQSLRHVVKRLARDNRIGEMKTTKFPRYFVEMSRG
jgi:hypothetical protein